MKKRLLLVEDDSSISLGLRMNLEREGYEVNLAEDGQLGLERVREGGYDLVLLDVMLPKLNGYELLDAVRKEGNNTHVLMLSARSSEMDKVMGLDLGADDYVPKPFSVAELLARVRAALRRGAPPPRGPVLNWRMGSVEVDPARRHVQKDGSEIELTAKEFEVLQLLKEARGRVLSRQAIFDHVWSGSHHGSLRTIDNFILQLRGKLEDDPADPRYLLTVRGVGYRLDIAGAAQG